MTQKTIQRHLRELRKTCIDGVDDPILRKIAYAMECAVRRETDPRLRSWPTLVEEAQALTKLLRYELAR